MAKETETEYYARPEVRRRCPITGELVSYETFCKAGSLVVAHNSLATIRKKNKLTNDQMRELLPTLIHSELTGGYYVNPDAYMQGVGQDKAHSLEEKEAEYDKLIRPHTRCNFPGCCETVPYGCSKLSTCSVNHYNALKSIRKGTSKLEDYTYRCELCNAVFTSNFRLTNHLTQEHNLTPEEQEAYYNKYIRKPGDPDGCCKWCGKPVPFVTIGVGYREFCRNTDCNVRWHNEHENRHIRASESFVETTKSGDVLETQVGYWIAKGLTEEEARACVRARQRTNTVTAIMAREGISEQEAIERRREITEKWLDSRVTGLNYSKVSQELFWAVWDLIKTTFSPTDVYFATFCGGERLPEDSRENKEYRIKTERSYRMADFYIDSLDLSIEFDGAWFHAKDAGWRESNFDELRDSEILVSRPNHKILHVSEEEYRKNPQVVVAKCCSFILRTYVDKQQA